MPVPLFQQRLNQNVPPRNGNDRFPPNETATVPPKPIIRGSGQELPVSTGIKTTLVSLPSPEEVGIRVEIPKEPLPAVSPRPDQVTETPIDWESLLSTLERRGAVGHQLERVGEGYRFVIRLSNEQIIGQGRTRNEAVQNALAKWKF